MSHGKGFVGAIPSPEQERVIQTWGQGMAVLAGAGSGKTTTLVTKCARLMERNSKSRFVAVSFTERSAGDLRAKLSETLLETQGPGSLKHHWVMTIHGLCARIIREFPREAGLYGEETVLTEVDAQLLWRRVIEGLWIEELPERVRVSFEQLLDRESRDSLSSLLRRVRDLSSFGILNALSNPALNSTDPTAMALAQVSGYVIEKYERLKRRQGVLDFNDLERGAHLALNFLNVRESYHHRFDLVLVDEFQDTNLIQSQIISRFARDDRSNLCVVGDPKQSIYRFRDADVSVFEDFCSHLPVKQSLTWNFRSRPGIIEFANQVCQKAFSASEMTFEALTPQRVESPEFQPVVRLDVQNPQELGAWIQGEVARGVPLHDMALLVRKVRGNEKWFKALASSGIPIAIGSGGLFWEDSRVRELVAFLKWWDNPGNSLSGGIFLRAPWVGIPDSELDQWILEDPTWIGPFFSSSHSLASCLQPFLNQVVRPGELLMALLINQKVEDELASPLLGLWHRVEELSSRGLDFHAIVMDLCLALDENRREREVPAPRNLGQLSVLTLHGAKGLEFPHVLLIDLAGKTRASDMPLLFWDRTQGAFLGMRDENGDRDRDHSLEIKWRENERKKNLEETKRLFYVALTRARERLVLVCLEQEDRVNPATFVPKKRTAKKEPSPDRVYYEDDWRGWIDSSGIILPSVLPFVQRGAESSSFAGIVAGMVPGMVKEVPTKEVTKEAPSRPIEPVLKPTRTRKWIRARHSVTEWNLLSHCPRAYEWKFIRPVVIQPAVPESAPTDPLSLDLPNLGSATLDSEGEITHLDLGSRVHSCLETRNFDGLHEIEAEVGSARFSAQPIVKWALGSPWMAPSNLEVGRQVWTELNFEVPLGSEVLVGTIDRLVLERNNHLNRYSLIDFKVTERPRSVSSLMGAYRTQMELYGWALCNLDPKVQPHDVEAALVNITANGVQVVRVALGKKDLEGLVQLSSEIVDGARGEPNPGVFCRICDFRSQCPEGNQDGI